MSVKDTTIWLQAEQGVWESVGTDRQRGIFAEAVSLKSDAGGPTSASFVLRRDGRQRFPDTRAFTPVDIDVGGVRVWSGRVKETPSTDGADRQVSVQCEGWQAHLDDDQYVPFYVAAKIDQFRDMRTFRTIDLTTLRQGAQVSTDDGAIVLSFPQNFGLNAGSNRVGVMLDLGPAAVARAVAMEWTSSNNAAAINVVVGTHTAENIWGGSGSDAFSETLASGATRSASGVAAAGRYVYVYLNYASGAATASADHYIRINALRVFAQSTSDYVSGGLSTLAATTVVVDALTHCPLLGGDRSLVQSTSFAIPALAPNEPRSPREMIDAVNAYHAWQLKIDERRTPVYRPVPTVARVKVGAGCAFTSEDSSANSGEEIYDKVIATWQTPAGEPGLLTATATADSIPVRRGFHRCHQLQIGSALPGDGIAAGQLANVWLTGKQSTPFKGSATITGPVEEILTGARVQPERLLLMTGDLLRFDDRIDPDTGATVRDGRIAEVTYTPATDTATVSIDSSRKDADALLARLAAVTG